MKSQYMNLKALVLLLTGCLFLGCSKEITNYRELLNKEEIVYTGPVSHLKAFQGNLRIKLQWHPSPDPSITKYVIYWNNKADSVALEAAHHNTLDSVNTIISGLGEFVQNFVLYTYDAKGNRSIGQSLSGVRIYGPLYVSSLVNRALDANRPPKNTGGGIYKLFFAGADTTLNVGTTLSYTGTDNLPYTVQVPGKYDTAMLAMTQAGTKIAIRSSYVPVFRAIDTFRVTYSDTLTLK